MEALFYGYETLLLVDIQLVNEYNKYRNLTRCKQRIFTFLIADMSMLNISDWI